MARRKYWRQIYFQTHFSGTLKHAKYHFEFELRHLQITGLYQVSCFQDPEEDLYLSYCYS